MPTPNLSRSELQAKYPGVLEINWTQEGWWLEIKHDGLVNWDTMQQIKNDWFGENVTCCEVYPAQSDLINNGNFRHLFRSPNIAEFC